ncbi:MAG: Formamidopyrimidine-DNA glycosylase [Candidatus Rifleibacterium amylolyticum]|nr:MAG: Formamidopyrimidine-DNA glycosylase [Candidatus Rifleibacterium amylolyticum]NLF97763.1 bifunctional DNA-formamidopyrimidine glycosylase/DNA-(apurinic or apyrimidinic site) lyase [Candidatus Riflebacteria bacterium]
MPELPEVNTLAVALARQLHNDSISSWQRLSPKLRKLIPDAAEAASVTCRKIKSVKRVAKNIFIDFGGQHLLKIHLGMTGYFCLTRQQPEAFKHAHLQLLLASGRTLTFCDPRRFGSIEVTSLPAARVVEPFAGELTPAYLKVACGGRECSIKALIMDQQVIAGLGNIYAAESLFKAGIRPDRPAGSLKPGEIKKLCAACIAVIEAAVKAGIDSLGERPEINDQTTHFDIETLVYDQHDELCPKCRKSRIKMVRISGRSSCFCPNCQK